MQIPPPELLEKNKVFIINPSLLAKRQQQPCTMVGRLFCSTTADHGIALKESIRRR
jgi:hypothetical protein